MKKQRLPKGWTEEEQVAEIEAALTDENQTLIAVPTELVPEIVRLIAKKRPTVNIPTRAKRPTIGGHGSLQ